MKPTRYMKGKESQYAIKCNPSMGPCFSDGSTIASDIFIGDQCNMINSCHIDNNGEYGFQCDPTLRKSLFVKTSSPDQTNYFSILDYEVYGIRNYKEYIYKVCAYPDLIWQYITTKDISNEILSNVDEKTILDDLNTIHCSDNYIRLKISASCFHDPSKYLSDTAIVNSCYDSSLISWLGQDTQWLLLYRASNYGMRAKSFHEFCDDKGPTLIVIKTIQGWILGGYTTQSWSGKCMYSHQWIIFHYRGVQERTGFIHFHIEEPS